MKNYIKLILLGEIGVGKTAIIQRYNENIFNNDINSTSNIGFIKKEVTINDQKVILELWDTVGQEQFRSVTQMFIKKSQIIVLVYEVTKIKSFESLDYWYDFIKKEFDEKVVLGLAGNKTDLIFEDGFDEEVFPEKGGLYSEKIGAHFSLVSAKESGKEINDLINELISKYLLLYDNDDTDLASSYSNIKLDENTNKQNNKNGCCGGKK